MLRVLKRGLSVTKKSNNRKYKMGETPVRFREQTLYIPMQMYDRILKAQSEATKMGLVDPKMPPADYIMVIMANGVGMMEADLIARQRKDSLVITPQEAAAIAHNQQAATPPPGGWPALATR